jgi:hypothetical protein
MTSRGKRAVRIADAATAAVVGVALAITLTSCSTSSDEPAVPSVLPSVPASLSGCTGQRGNVFTVCAAWDGPGRLLVVTVGSSTCPPAATAAELTGPQRVKVTIEPTGGPSCTADAVEAASTIAAPQGLDDTKPAVVEMFDKQVPLAPR